MCKELDYDICTIKKIIIHELCDGSSDKGKMRKKARALHRAMSKSRPKMTELSHF